jgi:CxxC motif-containing protein
MKTKELICIVCPNGCQLEVSYEVTPRIKVVKVFNHLCDKGETWAVNELENPTRHIASSILVEKGTFKLVSVRTDTPIPLTAIRKVMQTIKKKKVKPPIVINQVLIKNPAGVSTNIIATRNVDPLL